YHNLEKYEADISHCGFELVKADKTVKFHDTGVVLVQKRYEAINELLSGKHVEPGIWNKLYKKEIIGDVLFPTDIKINEDLLFNILVFKNSQKSVFEDRVKYRYMHVQTSASHSSQPLFIAEEVYKVAQRIKETLNSEEIKVEAEKFYVSKLLTSLKSLKKHHLFKSSLSEKYRIELKHNPTKNLGLRVFVLKNLLLYFPFFYDPFIYFYDLLFVKNQKWK
ncbi:MAG: hypothetical protein LC112_10415, partial [Flavobacteriales bacterium]|nr:hypothetical protein [Flavobacteriales bacterium]